MLLNIFFFFVGVLCDGEKGKKRRREKKIEVVFQLFNLQLTTITVAVGDSRRSVDEVFFSELPVDGAPEGIDVRSTVVLVVNVVGVFPNIAGEDGLNLFGQRIAGVVGLHNLQLARVAVLDEPGPAGAEVTDGSLSELLLELFEGTEGGLDFVSDTAGGFTTTGGGHGLPVEGVVPDLGGEVEDGSLFGHDHFFDGLLGEFRVGFSSGVELGDVAGVVLVVVELDLSLRDSLAGEIAVAPRKRRNGEDAHYNYDTI